MLDANDLNQTNIAVFTDGVLTMRHVIELKTFVKTHKIKSN